MLTPQLLANTSLGFVVPAILGEAAPPSMMDSLGGFFPMIAMIGLFYVLLIRPEGKKDKERRARLAEMEPGTKVVLNGGLLGEITKVEDEIANIRLAKGVTVSVLRREILDTQEAKLKSLESSAGEKK
ncbi:MAG: preprotein translocase subunit YajC [Nannocystaceae bacterium]